MTYEIKVINRDQVELTYRSGEIKFIAPFHRTGLDWKITKDDIKAECCGVEYSIAPDFMLQNKFFMSDWKSMIEGDVDYAASQWDGAE